MIDDHDQIWNDRRARYCAKDDGAKLILAAMAFTVTTLGIPGIYYGSEQYFDGRSQSKGSRFDYLLRECMHGGAFGSHQTQGRHFFDEESPAYKELATILKIRREKIALRRGRQYLREISGDGISYGYPTKLGDRIRSVVPWSRVLADHEILLAINTDPSNALNGLCDGRL